MIRSIVLTAALILLGITALPAQTANPKQLQPKSQKEVEALQAMFQAPDADTRIAAARNLITKFADSDFKGTAFYIMAFSYSQKGDIENIVVVGEEGLKADPKNYGIMLLMASALAQRTREFDLDKEEKLGRSEKFAKEAIELAKTAPKPNPQLTDEQWESGKKDYISQGYEALGLAAIARKKFDVCVDNLKMAVELAPAGDPATLVRLGNCYRQLKKYDEAIAVLDKALADANALPPVKQAAGQEKALSVAAKAQAK